MKTDQRPGGKHLMRVVSQRSPGQGESTPLDMGNRFLIVLIIILLGDVLVKHFPADRNARVSYPPHRTVVEKPLTADWTGIKPKPFHIYREGIRRRDLFNPPWDGSKPDTAALKKVLPVLHKRIKLIGILLDGDSKAIVEDLEERQTLFLSQGESIGTALLEDIREDKVIFIYNNERVEMVP